MRPLHARFVLGSATDDGTDSQPIGDGVQFPSGLVLCQVHLNDPPVLEGATSIDEFIAKLPAGWHVLWIDPPTKTASRTDPATPEEAGDG